MMTNTLIIITLPNLLKPPATGTSPQGVSLTDLRPLTALDAGRMVITPAMN